MCICIACKKKEATKTKNKVTGEFTYCAACYKQIRRKGYAKASVDTSDNVANLAMEVIKESAVNIYDGKTIKDAMQPMVKVRTTKIGDEVIAITESDPMSFFNKRTQDYNMMNGDKEMMKKVAGFRMTDIVDTKYRAQALTLSEAINDLNQIVCTDGIALGESLTGMPPAIDSQIAKMLGYNNTGKRYKECMKSLMDCGLIFKHECKDGMVNQLETIYYFNPVFQCAGKGVSPRLFFMFNKSFQLMAQKNKEFKYRYQQMANYSFKWMMDKRADFKQLQEDYNTGKITNVEAANGVTEIFSKIADSYQIPVRLETELDVDTTGMSAYEAIMTKHKSTVTYSNINKLTTKEEAIETTEDELNVLDASLAKEEIKVTTYSDIQRTVKVDGKELPVPANMPKKLPKVVVKKTATIVNDYGFEEEEYCLPISM